MGVLTGKRVLLLEDEIFIAFDTEEILLNLGAEEVCVAHSLSEAREVADKKSFDCAMLDRNLNGEYSDEFALRLVQQGVTVILATGYGSPGSASDITAVSKPYDQKMIEEAFEKHGQTA
jgi:DNA-binding NtrC family response regulator